jgi:hypothetical protein
MLCFRVGNLQRFSSQRTDPPNPSVKGTATSGLRPLVAAPYVER